MSKLTPEQLALFSIPNTPEEEANIRAAVENDPDTWIARPTNAAASSAGGAYGDHCRSEHDGLKLVSWNCNMALHRKFDAVVALGADIMVIQEAARPDILKAKGVDLAGWQSAWTGDNPNKGLLVLTRMPLTLEVAPCQAANNKHFIPVAIQARTTFHLLAVWSDNDRKKPGRRKEVGPTLRAIDLASDFLKAAPAMVVGDFNNDAQWDKPGKPNNMANITAALEDIGLTSAYHATTGEEPGSEETPTIYWRDRTKDGPSYHIDYIYTPTQGRGCLMTFEVGGYDEWIGNKLSDHVPLAAIISAK